MGDLEDAIAEAVAEAGGPVILDGTEPATPPEAPAPGEGEPSKGNLSTEGSAQAEPAEGTDTPEGGEAAEVPETYWGVPLDGIAPEKRAEIIAHFEQQDSTIQKLQAKLAVEPPAEGTQAPTPQEPPTEVSDEDLLRAVGIDPDDWNQSAVIPVVLPLLRQQLAMEDQLTAITQKEHVREVENSWNTELTTLEETYGALPFDRLQVLKFAVDEKISSPFEAYFRLSAPVKREVEDVVGKARLEAAKREAGGNLRPGTSNAGEPAITKEMSLRDAVKAAAESASKETGIPWKNVFRRGD